MHIGFGKMKNLSINDVCGEEVKIKILSIDDFCITAEVIYVDDFWLARSSDGKDFEVGMILKFRNDGEWAIIADPHGLPWFVLNDNGNFNHYR